MKEVEMFLQIELLELQANDFQKKAVSYSFAGSTTTQIFFEKQWYAMCLNCCEEEGVESMDKLTECVKRLL